MRKPDAEAALRGLCHVWKRGRFPDTPDGDLHFSDFYEWVRSNHPQLLEFRGTMGPSWHVEQWFDEEFGQTWRN